ncbi:MAG TPA: LysM peptidoglycan-binding domain-containing protein [Anaerolineales bacterium]|nr:LysM peptidoglycan-binding domain-containing protein [Anaerolineales bacterium]
MRYKPPYTLLKTRRARVGGGGGIRRGNILLYGLGAVSLLLTAGGLLVTTNWVRAGGPGALFPSDTPTPTMTFTPSNTPTITETPTLTPIPSTPTASAPFEYIVQSGDTITALAARFGLDPTLGPIIIMLLNGLDNDSVLTVGQVLIIPDPNMEVPTPTLLPDDLADFGRGHEILYFVMPGDTVAAIAERFFSTEDAIIEANDLENPNSIFAGQLLIVPVKLVTPTPGPSPTPLGTPPPNTLTPTP